MAFTTWQALYEAMLNQLASGNATVGSVTSGGKTITYKSTDDFLKQLAFVKARAEAETGTFVPRTYAKDGRRGSSTGAA